LADLRRSWLVWLNWKRRQPLRDFVCIGGVAGQFEYVFCGPGGREDICRFIGRV